MPARLLPAPCSASHDVDPKRDGPAGNSSSVAAGSAAPSRRWLSPQPLISAATRCVHVVALLEAQTNNSALE